MNALKPKTAFIKDELNIDRLTTQQYSGIIKAMENYADHYHETINSNSFEKPIKKIPSYDEILKAKLAYYGETMAAYEFAGQEYERQVNAILSR